jgi:CHAD domain-containing protein
MSSDGGQPGGSYGPAGAGIQPSSALAHYLLDQLAALEVHLPLAAAADPEAVHNARVALRRFRSVATCYRLLLPQFPADDVGLLKKLARDLGESRDAQVQAQRLALATEANGPWLREDLLRELAAGLRSHAADHAAAVRLVDVAAPLDRLRRIIRSPSRRQTGGPHVIAALQLRWQRVEALMGKASRPAATDEHHLRLHNVRRGLKGLRYSAEAVAGAFGEPALAIVRPAMALQRLLGEQHDSVVASAMLARAAQAGEADPADAAALAGLESRHALAAEKEYFRLAAGWPVPAPASILGPLASGAGGRER